MDPSPVSFSSLHSNGTVSYIAPKDVHDVPPPPILDSHLQVQIETQQLQQQEDLDFVNQQNSTLSQPSRKRRRSRKGLDKVFECDAPGCGKKFTRSEHLSRHQLNHAPKQIFKCTWPDCNKSFVREDLRVRHLDRHRRRGGNEDTNFKDEESMAGSLPETASATGSAITSIAGPVTTGSISTKLPYSQDSTQQFSPLPSMVMLPPPQTQIQPDQQAIPSIPQDQNPLSSQQSPSNATDLINWLFSDGMLSNARDLFLPSTLSNTFEYPLDLPNTLTPPTPPQGRVMSESKRLDILGLIPSLESHPDFELDCIHRFLALYWSKFHFQFPILHKPSFEADTTPGVLLLSMIMVGAYFGRGQDLALKIAEPLRWVIFGSPGFHPPAKIWIIQSLLILEVFEKTMSTRKFHERAHIHHGTTLQLIRRGTTLIGGHSPNANEQQVERSTSEIWKRWVDAEMAKRAAFMAFILDICHADLFAHSLVLSAHEIRLSLPCDEASWDSIPADRTKLLQTPTISFLKAVKRLLNQQSVTTGRFGSIILLGGLMSLSYQMEQLDLQISSLGWGAFRDTWRSTLGPALDFWRADYDRRFPQQLATSSYPGDNTVYERTMPPMLHLAHVAMWVSTYDMQIFSGVHRVLGRPTRYQDYVIARRRMNDWAISERAREAAWHAYKFLREVYIIGDQGSYYGKQPYTAAEDVFVHRPCTIFHCAQVVWSYGFCLEGPENNILGERDKINGEAKDSDEDAENLIPAAEDGKAFLERMCGARTGRELDAMEGKNRTVGLMRMISESMKAASWELLKEGCEHMSGNIQRSMGREDANVRGGRVYHDD
ncbi:fungal-specific transcription factor domain-containing protein [Lipomyces arxii]|uniref:fungal-specific transcription factor domain-containing protein n=1 Tax=Lipomyces arxii TaxID=56418 RepID=UPI0034CE6958